MKLTPYLNFDGTCAEAMRFYERVLGGEMLMMSTMGEGPMAEHTPPERHDRIMHARLRVGEGLLMASDVPGDSYARPKGITVSIEADGPEEAERIFAALAEGGEITMPLAETFWAHRFGMLTDRYGTPWMVDCEKQE